MNTQEISPSKIALVTGANGFIATHLQETLKASGITPIPVPRDLLYRQKHLDYFCKRYQPDYIFHLAAYGNMAHQTDTHMMFQANVETTWNLLQATREIPYKSLIIVSSSSVLLPVHTPYSATKEAAEKLIHAFSGKPITVVRPYSVYGCHEAEYRFIPTVFRSCLRHEAMTLDPEAYHDWVWIYDFCNALLHLAYQGEFYKGMSVNVGTARATSNSDVVELIEEITGQQAIISKRDKLRLFDTTDWKASYSDYLCHTPLSKGLRSLYESYKKLYI